MPNRLKNLFVRADELADSKDYDELIKVYTEILELAETRDAKSQTYYRRGVAYGSKGDYDQAIANYDQAIELNSKYTEAFNNRCNAYNAKGEYDKAIADCNQAIKLDSKNAKAFNNLGIAYNAKGEYDKAIESYDQSIKLDRLSAKAFNNRGNTYRNKREYDKAIADFDQAIEIDSEYADAFNSLGVAYGEKGERDKAIANYDRAIKLNPNHAKAYSNLGSTYSKKGEYDKAIVNFDKAIVLDPDFKSAIHNKGAALALQAAAAAQEATIRQYQDQLVRQQEDFDKKFEDYEVDVNKRFEGYAADIKEKFKDYRLDLWESGGYNDREKEYKEEFEKTTEKRDQALTRLANLALVGYGSIFLMIVFYLVKIGWLNIVKTEDIKSTLSLFEFVPLTLLVTLVLSIFVWNIRLINQNLDRLWALKEDAYTKGLLAKLVDFSTDIRNDMAKKFFDHHSNDSSAKIILNQPPTQTSPNPVSSLVEKIPVPKPPEKKQENSDESG